MTCRQCKLTLTDSCYLQETSTNGAPITSYSVDMCLLGDTFAEVTPFLNTCIICVNCDAVNK